MLFLQIVSSLLAFSIISVVNANPVPEPNPVPVPAPIDPALQPIIAAKNGMGGSLQMESESDNNRTSSNGALSSWQTPILSVSIPAIAVGAALVL